jgi:protein ImuB
MSFACIHIPNFPVQAVVRNEPDLRFRAVVITDGKSEAVIAANKAAREVGIQLGMIRSQVAQLPAIDIRPRSPAQEEVAHAALLDLSFVFSPRVEDTAADTLTLDLDGLERVCGPPENIAHNLVQLASELGLDVHVAVAPNPDAAFHAARGFTGITLIESGVTSERLGPLPVSILAPSDEIMETLNRWGIQTFKALASLPTAELSERLGQAGVHLQKLARGAWLRPLIPVQPSLHFEEVMELEYAEEELEPLSFILGRLLGQLCARLTARGLAANELRLVLDLAPESAESSGQGAEGSKHSLVAPTFRSARSENSQNADLRVGATKSTAETATISPTKYEKTLRLPVPMRDSKVLLKLLQLNLSSHPPPAPIRKITITAEPAKPRFAQGGLFAPISPDPEKLEITLARIGALIGAKNLGSPELLNTHRPSAFGMIKFNPLSADPASAKQLRTLSMPAELSEGPPQPRPPIPPLVTPLSERRISPEIQIAGQRPALQAKCPDPIGTSEGGEERRGPFLISSPSTYQRALSHGAGPCEGAKSPTSANHSHSKPPKAAMRIFRPPVPATVETCNGFPVRVFFSGLRGDAISVAGPWRSSGDWWTEESWLQDEWDVEIKVRSGIRSRPITEQKQTQIRESVLYRIYRDAATGNWFVRGSYD